jgi:hypothetical protein
VIEDRYLLDKDERSFDRVIGTKLDPLLTLAGVLDHRRLKVVMLFSSVAGFYGNPGQGDYAAANEILNRIARRLQDTLGVRVVAMNWGPWAGAGMVTREVARQFEERGVGMVTTRAGREAAWRELIAGGGDDVVVIVGPGPWVRRVERSGPARPAGRTEDDLRRTGRAPSPA